jgi:hypothetical protein
MGPILQLRMTRALHACAHTRENYSHCSQSYLHCFEKALCCLALISGGRIWNGFQKLPNISQAEHLAKLWPSVEPRWQ